MNRTEGVYAGWRNGTRFGVSSVFSERKDTIQKEQISESGSLSRVSSVGSNPLEFGADSFRQILL